MGAPRAWTTVSGLTPADKAIAVQGDESMRTVNFDPAFARVEIDTSVTPPRVKVTGGATISALGESIEDLEREIEGLDERLDELEAKQFTPTELQSTSYNADIWEHVLVDMDAASGDLTITLPPSSLLNVGARIKVSDISVGGGIGVGGYIKISATFASGSAGHFATSPYSVAADIPNGGSKVGAFIDLIDVGTGWFVVAEGCRP